jgi:uncharacterized protein YutE (UPF0331/DUF86 family)
LFDADLVQTKLEKLQQYVALLEKLSKQPMESFVSDAFVRGNVERYLQLSIQACLDIGNHLLASNSTISPEAYRDIFIYLGEKNIIPQELAEKIAPLAGLRNILVHDYMEVDITRLFSFLKNDLTDFKRFAEHISLYAFGQK